jgi:hypothetical protein
LSALARRFGLLVARFFCSFAAFGFLVARRFWPRVGFGFRRLIRFGSAQSTLSARQAAVATHQQQHNKALHPTAYSFGFRSCLASAYASGGG